MALFYTNLLIALAWMGLSGHYNSNAFIIGFLTGFIMLALFEPLFAPITYTRRIFYFVRFGLYFLKAFILANVAVIQSILFKPISDLDPDIIEYDVSELSDFETMLLANSITLTPGTTTIDSTDTHLVIHALDGRDPDAVRRSIKDELLTPILRFSR